MSFVDAVFPPTDPWCCFNDTKRWRGQSYRWVRCSSGDCPPEWYESGVNWVFHGTSLSIAWRIFRMGLQAGHGQHGKNGRTVRGHFFITGQNLDECLLRARDRATVTRCTEWTTWGVPSGWSVPCVIVFRYPAHDLVTLGSVGSCNKSALEGMPGDLIRIEEMMSRSCHLYVLRDEIENYRQVQLIQGLQSHMMCGGRQGDALAWAKRGMSPSCGRCVPLGRLPQNGWVQSNQKIWYCTACYARKTSEGL